MFEYVSYNTRGKKPVGGPIGRQQVFLSTERVNFQKCTCDTYAKFSCEKKGLRGKLRKRRQSVSVFIFRALMKIGK